MFAVDSPPTSTAAASLARRRTGPGAQLLPKESGALLQPLLCRRRSACVCQRNLLCLRSRRRRHHTNADAVAAAITQRRPDAPDAPVPHKAVAASAGKPPPNQTSESLAVARTLALRRRRDDCNCLLDSARAHKFTHVSARHTLRRRIDPHRNAVYALDAPLSSLACDLGAAATAAIERV